MIPYKDVDMDDPNVLIMIGYAHYFHYKNDIPVPPTKGKFLAADWSCIFERTGDFEALDYGYYLHYKKEFDVLEKMLADAKSKCLLEAWINQKITGDFKYLKDLNDTNQYFDDIVNLKKVNCFVDCGAYQGDSYLAFINNYKKRVGINYSGRAYLWEPNHENIVMICKNLKGYNNFEIIPKGSYDNADVLFFSGNDSNGIISEAGDISVEVDSIDNIVKEKIDFIKMDIEGSEFNSLLGAREHIINDHPILAICAYHRKDDLLRIPQLIKSYYDGYKIYLRHYSKHTLELVVYAIPE